MDIQVDKTHYDFKTYLKSNRWASYYQQIAETMACQGKNVLYVGLGDNIVVDTLKKFGKNVKTLDFDPELKPDYTGSVTEISKVLGKDKHKFDVIICSQVLEHIPFEQFEATIKQLADCANEKLILSLPNNLAFIKLQLQNLQLAIPVKKPFRRTWELAKQGRGEHYWEIDAKGCIHKKDLEKLLAKYFTIEKVYRPFNNTYHVFFILGRKS